MKANNEKANVANANNNNNESNATATPATDATDAKVVKAIEQKRSDILKECFKSIELSKIASDTRAKFEGAGFGKFTAIYRPSDKKENGKFGKSGGKTIYNFETPTTIYMGYTSSELSDVFHLEKRQYKKNGESNGESNGDNSTIIALRALKESIEKLNNIEKYKTMFAAVKVEDIEKAIESERATAKEISDFIAQRGTDIEDSTTYTEESKLLEEYGTKFVAKLKTYKLGFFAPKETTDNTGSQESQESQESTDESK